MKNLQTQITVLLLTLTFLFTHAIRHGMYQHVYSLNTFDNFTLHTCK